LTCAHLHCTILLQGGDTVDRETLKKTGNILSFLIMAHIILKNLYYIKLNGFTTNYIINITGAIIIYLFIQIEILEKDIKKTEKQINKKRQAKIDNIYNELAEQDKYLNKQIVTGQYKEQKAKKDGK